MTAQTPVQIDTPSTAPRVGPSAETPIATPKNWSTICIAASTNRPPQMGPHLNSLAPLASISSRMAVSFWVARVLLQDRFQRRAAHERLLSGSLVRSSYSLLPQGQL